MVRAFSAALLIALGAAGLVPAATISLKVDSGEVKLLRPSAPWAAVTDTATCETGDSIATGDNGYAMLVLASDASIKMKGATQLGITVQDKGLTVAVTRGQIFLNKVQAEAFSMIMMLARDVKFVPLGTAFALRIDKMGEPSVAVLRGKVRADLPNGQSFEVQPGQVGTFDHATGLFKQNDLPAAAVANLEQWSGLTLEKVEAVAQAPKSAEPPAAATAPAIPASSAPAPATATPATQAAATSTTPPAGGSQAATQPGAPASVQPGQQPSGGVEKKAEENKPAEPKAGESPAAGGVEKPTYEISAGSVTVDNQQWTRIAVGADIPIWKFGIGLDVELFLDPQGKFSDKGWNFDKDDWGESVLRKIRYVRFGHENDPVFIKIGGLSNVTLGYGFVVDRFTNMLHYPDEKDLGVQFYLNDLTPIGFTLQTFVADLRDFKYDGGVMAGRLGFKPLKATGIPILGGLNLAGTYATDLNEYAPARRWDLTPPGSVAAYNDLITAGYSSDSARKHVMSAYGLPDPVSDSTSYVAKLAAARAWLPFSIIGGDIGLPIITTKVVELDIYGQGGIRGDNVHGWGFGAPGAKLTVGPAWLQAEYRHIDGQFEPGFFGPYYLDERLDTSSGIITPKSKSLVDAKLNGVYGQLGVSIANALIISGTYQYLVGSSSSDKDQRFEATAGLGDAIVKKIPKLAKLEGYIYKTGIGTEPVYDKNGNLVRNTDMFFDPTPSMYWGYRVGLAVTQGAAIIMDNRYGYQYDANNHRQPNNNVSIMTAVTF